MRNSVLDLPLKWSPLNWIASNAGGAPGMASQAQGMSTTLTTGARNRESTNRFEGLKEFALRAPNHGEERGVLFLLPFVWI